MKSLWSILNICIQSPENNTTTVFKRGIGTLIGNHQARNLAQKARIILNHSIFLIENRMSQNFQNENKHFFLNLII